MYFDFKSLKRLSFQLPSTNRFPHLPQAYTPQVRKYSSQLYVAGEVRVLCFILQKQVPLATF